MIAKEVQEAGEEALALFKQRVFASAFGSFDPNNRVTQYYKLFEDDKRTEPDPEKIAEFVPETEADVQTMLTAAFRAGIITPDAGD